MLLPFLSWNVASLSGPSVSRKRHESVMDSAMNSNIGSGPKR
jgi:hypothetical protein